MTAGEAAMTVALANSLFLSMSPDAARGKVVLFLALSLAPFAVVSPLIGPVIDRMKGGRRLVVCLAAAGRAIVTLLMIGRIDSLTLFPLAFAAMVLSKTYSVSKSALVPTVVKSESDLVEANSRLGLLAGVVGFVVAIPAGLLQLLSDNAPLFLSVAFFIGAVVSATQLPRGERVSQAPPTQAERDELHSPRLLRASRTMWLMRGLVGFMFFHLAFWLRDQKAGTVWFGFAVALSTLATMAGNALSPMLRRKLHEETMMLSALLTLTIVGFFTTYVGGVTGGVILAATVNCAAAICRLAFESVVQSDAPDVNRARAFAVFETQNQLAWVLAGLIPVLFRISGDVGFALVGITTALGMLIFVMWGRFSIRIQGGQAIGLGRRPRRG